MKMNDLNEIIKDNMLFSFSLGGYIIPRDDKWDDRFASFFTKFAMDYHGHSIIGKYKPGIIINNRGGISTAKFDVFPYYWGDDESEELKPNFIYYPTDFEIRWYKYPLRGAYCNKPITYEEFDQMLSDCEEVTL